MVGKLMWKAMGEVLLTGVRSVGYEFNNSSASFDYVKYLGCAISACYEMMQDGSNSHLMYTNVLLMVGIF